MEGPVRARGLVSGFTMESDKAVAQAWAGETWKTSLGLNGQDLCQGQKWGREEEGEEEPGPDQRAGKQGTAERVKMVLVRQLGRGSQSHGQGHTVNVGAGIFRGRQMGWREETGHQLMS